MTLRVADVIDILEAAYPPALAQGWDVNGLSVGDPGAEVTRIHLSVDITPAVVAEALETGAQMLVTHHPIFLRGTNAVSRLTAKGRMVHDLIRGGCALYNAHTNADSARDGVAQALAELAGLGPDAVPLEPAAGEAGAAGLGIGRVGALAQPVSLGELAARIAGALPHTEFGVLVGGPVDAQIRTLAVSGGSGDSLFGAARASGADAFLTADLRHHPAQDHLADGKPWLINATHWATEWVWLPKAAALLQARAAERGDELTCTVSVLPTDPWTARF
ncbi:Nif3-like dinuclear metal center hexameric protein [Buchananella felis]|uniref:Nif3-like dinuclear metal center hexameric protein n=1 Tax=Buchananella felis TaxID=3231492 RepID=UPI00352855A8